MFIIAMKQKINKKRITRQAVGIQHMMCFILCNKW